MGNVVSAVQGAASGAAVGSAVNPGWGTVLGGIGGAIASLFGSKPEKTTAGNDKSYIAAVQTEVQSEYDIAARALSVVNPNDKNTQNAIQTAYNTELSLWGNLSNPNRNSANPAGFKSAMQQIIDSYSYNPLQFSNTNGTNTNLFDSSTGNVLNGTSGQIITNPPVQTTQLPQQAATDYTPVILIGGVILIAAIFLMRR